MLLENEDVELDLEFLEKKKYMQWIAYRVSRQAGGHDERYETTLDGTQLLNNFHFSFSAEHANCSKLW